MLNPSLQAGVASPQETVPCKGTTAENDHWHDRYQWVTAYAKKQAHGHGQPLFLRPIVFSAKSTAPKEDKARLALRSPRSCQHSRLEAASPRSHSFTGADREG
jgi:hypothetical protein